MSSLSLLVEEDWHPKAVTTGPAEGSLPAPLLRCPGFAGLDCFPFLLLSGFPLPPPLRKPVSKRRKRSSVNSQGPPRPLTTFPPPYPQSLSQGYRIEKKKKIFHQTKPCLLCFWLFYMLLHFWRKSSLVLSISPLLTLLLDLSVLPGGELTLCTLC